MNDFIEDYGEYVVLSIVVGVGITLFQGLTQIVTNMF